MQTTLCPSCNAPAPEYDKYQDLAHEVLSTIAAGVTIMRLTNEGSDAAKAQLGERSHKWIERATDDLHRGNDMRESFADENSRSVHRECDAWKITQRRLNALLMELDYVRRIVRQLGWK